MQEPVLVGEVDQLGREVAVVEDVAVAERGALRIARGARRVLDVDRVVGRQRPGHRLEQRDAGVADVVVGPLGAVEEPHHLEGLDVAADLVDHRAVAAALELLGRDQQPGAGLLQRVGKLMGAVGRVDVDQDRADLGGGVLRDRPLGAVRCPHADPVALGDARSDQADGQRVDVAVELRPGPAASAGELDQRLTVRMSDHRGLEVRTDGLVEERRVSLSPGVGLHGSDATPGRLAWRRTGSRTSRPSRAASIS